MQRRETYKFMAGYDGTWHLLHPIHPSSLPVKDILPTHYHHDCLFFALLLYFAGWYRQ